MSVLRERMVCFKNITQVKYGEGIGAGQERG
jgi:hypothetical protein